MSTSSSSGIAVMSLLFSTVRTCHWLYGALRPLRSWVTFAVGATEQSLQLFNVDNYPVHVQVWVDDGDFNSVPQESKAPTIVLPPVFRMGQGDQTSLSLINSGAPPRSSWRMRRKKPTLVWSPRFSAPLSILTHYMPTRVKMQKCYFRSSAMMAIR
nr:fimbria/pilus periplasmic chaperone [Paraburkholderia sp. HP33-1]